MENSALEKFLSSWEPVLGEKPVHLGYGRVVVGPKDGPPLVYLLVGPTALHVVSAGGQDTILGFATKKDRVEEVRPPISIARADVVLTDLTPAGWWERFWATREVFELSSAGDPRLRWRLQLFTPAREFLAKVSEFWT